MATWSDIDELCAALPEVAPSSKDRQGWDLRGKGLVWERPLRKGDLTALGDAAPTGEVICVLTADLDAKEQALAEVVGAFTTPHFRGYPAVLLVLAEVDPADLQDLLEQTWVAKATKRAVKARQSEH